MSIRNQSCSTLMALTLTLLAISVAQGDDSESSSPSDQPDVLTIGSKAPTLDVEHWFSFGRHDFEEVTEFDSGHVYVVEFWATWCGPCLASMPHLAELQQKHADDDVQIVSISDEPKKTVETFLKREVRRYRAASPAEGTENVDADAKKATYADLTAAYCLTSDPDRSSHKAYMTAAGQTGIPTSFIVGKSGLVEWIGHPMRMDEPLTQIIKDTWNRDDFALKFKQEQELKIARRKVRGYLRRNDHESAVELLSELVESAADESKPYLQAELIPVLLKADRIEQAAEVLESTISNLDARSLNEVAWEIYLRSTKQDDLQGSKIFDLGIAAAEAAVKLEPDSALILDTLAHLVHLKGDTRRAWELQSKAAKSQPARPDIAKFLRQLEDELSSESESDDVQETGEEEE